MTGAPSVLAEVDHATRWDDGAGTVALHLLSSFELRAGDTALELKPASQRLLAYVSLGEHGVDRGAAAFRLWPDKSEARAQANLRSALWRLRQQPVALIDATSTQLRLHPGVWVDARHGLDHLKHAGVDAVLDAADVSGTASRPAVGLGGALLPEWYDDWLLIDRERVRQVQLRCIEQACEELLNQARWAEAVELGLCAVALEPLRESAHRLVIRGHLGAGNRVEARRHFSMCTRMLDVELGVAPTAELVGLTQSA